MDRLLSEALDLAGRALQAEDAFPEVLVEGTASVLGRPELADLARVQRVLDTFAEKASRRLMDCAIGIERAVASAQ